MKRTRIVAVLATTMGLALAVSACGSNTTPSASTSAAGPGSAGGTLSILSGTATEHWDPQRVYVGVNIASGNRMFSRTLTTFSPVAKDGEVPELVADAATDTGTASADAKEWKFTIKDGVKWEDGKAVTCEDFKYGISRTFAVEVITGGPNYAIQYLDIPKNKDGSSAYAGPYKKTGQDAYDKAVTCDGTTITFKMAAPAGDFNMAATMTAFGAFRADKDLGDKSNYAIFSNGPYKLEGTWSANKGGTFVRNDQWDPKTDGFRKAFPDNLEDDEVQLLLGLVARPIREFGAPPTASEELEEGAEDLLGFAVEAHARTPTSGPALIESKVLADPDLTRELTPEERASLPTRGTLLVLRAQYRNQHGVRGLRLLQTLTRLVATQRGALIHDPDTLETHGPAAFAARRLQTSLGNVADQIPVVPFPDPRHTGRFRLATRGMRRFGSVDLELDGLPGELPTLQHATFFLHGLARMMIDLGEFEDGFAAELPPTLTLHHSDCAAAYAGRPGDLPRCKDCPESVDLHLVERAAEPQDAISHVVARVVAPRPRSDQRTHDHLQWVQDALTRVFGSPIPGGPAPI